MTPIRLSQRLSRRQSRKGYPSGTPAPRHSRMGLGASWGSSCGVPCFSPAQEAQARSAAPAVDGAARHASFREAGGRQRRSCQRARAVREVRSSLSRILLTWFSTVRSDKVSCRAIAALLSPWATSAVTSASRGVSTGSPLARPEQRLDLVDQRCHAEPPRQLERDVGVLAAGARADRLERQRARRARTPWPAGRGAPRRPPARIADARLPR